MFKPVSIKTFYVFKCEISDRPGIAYHCPSKPITALSAFLNMYSDLVPDPNLIHSNLAKKYYSNCFFFHFNFEITNNKKFN